MKKSILLNQMTKRYICLSLDVYLVCMRHIIPFEFLLKTNGGRIDLVSDDVDHGFYVDPIDEEDIWIESLYGIGESARNWLVYFNELYADETMGGLIIGDTLSHGFIVYDYLGVLEDDGGIYFWDDKRAYKTSSDEGNVYFVANDFDELIKMSNIKFD